MKLTMLQKDQIVKIAVAATFAVREETLKQDKHTIAEMVYAANYPAAIQQKMAALPEEFFNSKSSMYVNHKGRTEQVDLVSSKKVKPDHIYRQSPCLIPESPEDIAYIEAFFKTLDVLRREKDMLKAELKGFLKSITTVKQLRERWPEGEPHYKEILGAPTPNLPAPQAADLNKMMETFKQKA